MSEQAAKADQQDADQKAEQKKKQHTDQQQYRSYSVRFRESQPAFSSTSRIRNLNAGEIVMAQTDHGLEPCKITGPGAIHPEDPNEQPKATYFLVRRANREEEEKYISLVERENEAFKHCQGFIKKHQLVMKLISVERYFNGSKIIFYFTAENRVDFRELVKDLVQEYRTRVEMRQIGVRHETKMIGGIGCCGRELCCSSYLTSFAPVSIKMAKEQDLPLNPSKISGICNRLLCCLTYEFNTYAEIKKTMPRQGKMIKYEGNTYKVLQVNTLHESITVINVDDPDGPMALNKEEWQKASFDIPKKPSKKKKEDRNKKKR